jgi:coenzyme F420 hydrogenase subunit beta
MLCAEICPVVPVEDMVDMSKKVFKNKDIFGQCLASYTGYSSNEFIRRKAASGGVVTTLLLNAVEHKDIDGVLVVVQKEGRPFESVAKIINDKGEISKSMGSRYLPVEYSEALKQLLDDDSLRSVGVVGSPCHIDGIRRACLKIPKLRMKISFTIALFCKQTKDVRFTDMILAKIGIDKNEVKEIRYRGNGWPGLIQITSKDGKIVTYPYEKFSSLWGTFSCAPLHCLLCTTAMGESADLAVGDAWLNKYRDNKSGVSAILVRTQDGEKIINQAVQDKKICVEYVNPRAVVDAQSRFVVATKKKNFVYRLRILGFFNSEISSLCIDVKPFVKKSVRSLEFLLVLGMRCMTSSVFFRRSFPFLPNIILKMLSRGLFTLWRLLSGPC